MEKNHLLKKRYTTPMQRVDVDVNALVIEGQRAVEIGFVVIDALMAVLCIRVDKGVRFLQIDSTYLNGATGGHVDILTSLKEGDSRD